MSQLLLHIPEPCAQSWAAMTPASAGRHCAACQKTVVDFTQKTDAEILAYFRQGHPDTCGHFRPEQLGRPLVVRPAAPQHWQLWLAGLLVAALTAQGCQRTTGEPQRAVVPRHLAPSPAYRSDLPAQPALTGDTVLVAAPLPGEAVPDSAIASPASAAPECLLPTGVLGRPVPLSHPRSPKPRASAKP